ncbi:TIGR00269 family protein [Methanothermococcus okinawensis]|uniref:Uncharacterized protein n=1 Tax=Methanothermococcus okinawensis (strain DSM 14208 / JCM 11175 / IH1) TaxID=647113 RepID=F8AL62_METOI|nr:TIGR00269 family protein [Methanothermococcus okinawensis]AEH06479.1 protein of unknown function UPF0021 [Methanothermococcus okinawensis IH1]
MKCSICKKNISFYHQRHSGLNFCKECFVKYIKKKVRKTLGKNIIKQNMTIGMGLSGGKDSLVMAYILNEFYKPIPNSNIIALIVDEGIEGFRKDGVNMAIKFCEEYDIAYKIATFKEYIGYDLDELVKIAKDKNLTMNPCSFCGVIRRKILNKMALNEKCNYLAIGHNLDDMAQAIMMNYIEGDVKKLAILGHDANNPMFVKRIKPLKYIPENEVLLFADLLEIKYHKAPCPYSSMSYRAEISDIIDKLEENHPGTKYSIVSGFEKLLEYLPVEKEMNVCKYCNEPSASEICKVCMFLEKLGILNV